jgi:hypothetical protein
MAAPAVIATRSVMLFSLSVIATSLIARAMFAASFGQVIQDAL